MNELQSIDSATWAVMVLVPATVFTILWLFDALTHERLVHVDITDKELQVHRSILVASVVMELSLLGMYFFLWPCLPLFVASFITRAAIEFMDELVFHVHRCDKRETFIHLGMWITVYAKTIALFLWGFFLSYKGVDQLSFLFYLWASLVFGAMGWISFQEWGRGNSVQKI